MAPPKKNFHIGNIGTKKFTLPRDAVTQTFGILAKRGAGKTYAGLVMAEEMLASGAQVVIFDPLDVTWGLRTSADGKGKGFSIIVFGGEHGDLPLKEEHAVTIADFIVEDRISCIISTRHLSKSAQRRFITAFAERLYHRKGEGKHRTPVHLIIDEADSFAPQRVQKGAERMLGAIDDLVRRGRASGIGVTLITQRPASIHKDVLTQIECLVCLRIVSPHDRKAIREWIEAHDAHNQRDEFQRSLAGLPIGTAWFWSPGWLNLFSCVKVRKRKTFDSSATPKSGSRSRAPGKVAKIDMSKLKKRLTNVVEQAKADDPKELKNRIRELEKAAKRGVKAVPPDPANLQAAVHKKAMQLVGKVKRDLDGDLKNLRSMARKFGISFHAADMDAEKLLEIVKELDWEVALDRRELTSADKKELVRDVRQSAPPTPVAPLTIGDSNLGKCPKAVLTTLAQRAKPTTKKQAAIISGYSGKSGGFNNALSKLRSHGYMEGTASGLRITEAGIEALGGYEPLPSGADLAAYWIRKLGKCPARILQVLVDHYPDSMDKQELGDATEYSPNSGGFNNALSRLRTLELATRGPDIQASPELLEG